MDNILQTALNAKLRSIMEVIAKQQGYGAELNALTVSVCLGLQNDAEQAVIDWTVARQTAARNLVPITNLQHLLAEYCAIADHL